MRGPPARPSVCRMHPAHEARQKRVRVGISAGLPRMYVHDEQSGFASACARGKGAERTALEFRSRNQVLGGCARRPLLGIAQLRRLFPDVGGLSNSSITSQLSGRFWLSCRAGFALRLITPRQASIPCTSQECTRVYRNFSGWVAELESLAERVVACYSSWL